MPNPILIVGAGPTGLTAAVELARRGILPTVIEARDAPSTLSRAVGIQPRSMRLLEPSGVTEAIRAEAIPIERAIFHDHDAPILTLPLATDPDPDERLFSLAQDRTEALLRDAFERIGGEVRYGHRLDGLAQDAGGVTATVAGRPERYDRVIGADGVRSAVRAALGVGFPGTRLPKKWSIADVISETWADAESFQVFLNDGSEVVILVPIATHRYRLISNTTDALAALPVPMETTHVNRTAAFHIDVRQAETYTVGRVHLAGDAAHCHSPFGGRGMNLGIADAADLARRIAEDDVPGYADTRHEVGAKVIAFSERGRKAVLAESHLAQGLLRTAMRVVDRLDGFKRHRLQELLLEG